MWYTIAECLTPQGELKGTYFVIAGPDLEGGGWQADRREFDSVEAAMADYGRVAWREPDADACPEILKVGSDEEPSSWRTGPTREEGLECGTPLPNA